MKKYLPHIAFGLMAAQVLLMLVSWLLNAAYPVSGIRSLLSNEGLRWLFGHFADMLATQQLVWLILLSMAYGCLHRSSVMSRHATYRERRALTIALLMLTIIAVVLVLLTAIPHAVLLSATGRLWPSPFSFSLVPVLAFSIIICSTLYGIIAGTFKNLSDIYESILYGIRKGAPWLLFYVLLVQIYVSLMFILP